MDPINGSKSPKHKSFFSTDLENFQKMQEQYPPTLLWYSP